MPSKALSYARQGTDTSIHTRPVRNQMQDYADVKFVESHGAALGQVERAFYATARPAKNRFHWMFPPDKDERVASLLAWIQAVSYGLASFGLHKFLQSRERGALFVNADYRPTESPNEPAFDWLTFEELQPTRDQILQESVAYYDPAVYVIVFVFLPSESGNSMAIWRRKIVVPNNVRLTFQPQIKQTLAALRKKYVLHVDE
ncbi:hypothetical protein FIBSPDRAFT_755480 [Athelia psychrophila]|uniref:CcmS related domain-containing protein n=1 Tax=Athelia psychrophila TaxID=1759441 RepID=A0A166AY76_9AGAM|nr:hypothetical protein FIBSPDRAFT_755480 [Fibularhizoctonia sp. CBS 109695]